MRIDSANYPAAQPQQAPKSKRTSGETDTTRTGNTESRYGNSAGIYGDSVAPKSAGEYSARGLVAKSTLTAGATTENVSDADYAKEMLTFSKLNLLYEANAVLVDQIDRTADRYLRMFS